MKFEFGHVCLVSRDIDALAAFYIVTLGLQECWKTQYSTGGLSGYCVELADGKQIEMFKSDVADTGRAERVAHICLKVDDIESVQVWLEKRGVVQDGHKPGQELWIQDPDGNRIELRKK